MLIPHREGHHPLVKAGFRENGFRILVNQFENPLAPPLDLALQRTHGATLKLPLGFGKDDQVMAVCSAARTRVGKLAWILRRTDTNLRAITQRRFVLSPGPLSPKPTRRRLHLMAMTNGRGASSSASARFSRPIVKCFSSSTERRLIRWL